MTRKARVLGLLAGLIVVAAAGAIVGGWKPWSAAGTQSSDSGSNRSAVSVAPIGERSVPTHVSTSPMTPLTTQPTPGALEPGPGAPVATDAPLPTTGGNVSVTVTYSGWNDSSSSVEVTGFVAGVLEQGGVCTLTLTNGPATVTEQRTAVADVSTISCGTIAVAGTRLAPGEWRAVLAYRSTSSNGVSSPVSVTVPAR